MTVSMSAGHGLVVAQCNDQAAQTSMGSEAFWR